MTIFTDTADGKVATATSDLFTWFFGLDYMMVERVSGNRFFLQTGRYEDSDLGLVAAETLAAARALSHEIYDENNRRDEAKQALRSAACGTTAELLSAIPAAAQAELDALNRRLADIAAAVNEGGEGFVPNVDWDSPIGREIAARHGLDASVIDRIHTLAGKDN